MPGSGTSPSGWRRPGPVRNRATSAQPGACSRERTRESNECRANNYLQSRIALLAGCGPKPKTVVERVVEPCPLEVEPPNCPDFPPHGGKPWEVVIDERDPTYAQCRGWARTFWKARQDCEKAEH